jgi:hypothetical protein
MLIIPNIGIKLSIFFGLLKAGGVLQRTPESTRADRATRRELEKSETIPESSNMAGKSPS